MRRFYQACLFVMLSLALSSYVVAQQDTLERPTKSAQQEQPDMGAMLIKGLKDVDGCIDVKTCEWSDGKQSIVAWFKNKEAAASWYYSRTHQGVMRNLTDGSMEDEEPMEHIKDEEQPIMVMATLTPSDRPELPGMKIPISQISIELFAPLPGGAQIGGRVSPKGFKVPHMDDYTPKKSSSENHEHSKSKKQ